MRLFTTTACFALLGLAACDDHGHEHENEVITTVTLTLTPMGGGTAITASFDDPDGDGGAAPTVDAIQLAAGTTYDVSVAFLNGLEEPAEDLTPEIRDEGDEHMVFFTGTAVDGPAAGNPNAPITHAYTDQDSAGVPIGLANRFVVRPGTGKLTVTLRHMPPVDGTPVKTTGTAATVKSSGFGTLSGSNDAQVDFSATVL